MEKEKKVFQFEMKKVQLLYLLYSLVKSGIEKAEWKFSPQFIDSVTVTLSSVPLQYREKKNNFHHQQKTHPKKVVLNSRLINWKFLPSCLFFSNLSRSLESLHPPYPYPTPIHSSRRSKQYGKNLFKSSHHIHAELYVNIGGKFSNMLLSHKFIFAFSTHTPHFTLSSF